MRTDDRARVRTLPVQVRDLLLLRELDGDRGRVWSSLD